MIFLRLTDKLRTPYSCGTERTTDECTQVLLTSYSAKYKQQNAGNWLIMINKITTTTVEQAAQLKFKM